MKHASTEFATAGVWGLHISSYLVASIPYLQFASLTLAIVVSVVTLIKLLKGRNNKNDVVF